MNAIEYDKELVSFESTSALSNVSISDYVESTLDRLGFAIERIEYEDAGGVRKVNVIGKKGRGTGGMAYFGHSDVVPADPWFSEEHGPFSPTVKGDRLYGRGSCDMKGSIACMLSAVERFSTADLKKPVYITCTADEEIGYGGAAQVAERSQLYAEMVEGESNGIIGEPTMLEVVHAHKGTCGFVATSHGRAAHSSTREGLNANLAMIPFLVEMKRIYDETESDPVWRNDEYDPPTLSWNIGVNDHTKAINVTPESSVCTVYFRPMPGMDVDPLLERVQQAAERFGLEFRIESRDEPVSVDSGSAFIEELLRVAGKRASRTVSYCTDGAKFQAMKKLAVFGPGDIAQAHTHDEWIALDQLERGTEVYSKLIQHWCCQGGSRVTVHPR